MKTAKETNTMNEKDKPRNQKKKGKASILFYLKEKTEYCSLSIGVFTHLADWPVKSASHELANPV